MLLWLSDLLLLRSLASRWHPLCKHGGVGGCVSVQLVATRAKYNKQEFEVMYSMGLDVAADLLTDEIALGQFSRMLKSVFIKRVRERWGTLVALIPDQGVPVLPEVHSSWMRITFLLGGSGYD